MQSVANTDIILIFENKMAKSRPEQLTKSYLALLEAHVKDLVKGKEVRANEISDFASKLNVHPVHLSNTVKAVTGLSTCYLYENQLLNPAKSLLNNTDLSIKEIALRLTYDPSNFTKFFKMYTGQSPKEFRKNIISENT